MASDKSAQIIDVAREMGASLAGIAGVEQLKDSPSHRILNTHTGLEIADSPASPGRAPPVPPS